MNKKLYIQPTLEVFNVEKCDIICASILEYDGPLGAKGGLEDSSLDLEMSEDDSNIW